MPRAYRLGRRKQSVDETRARIVAGARALLMSQDGFRRFTMEAIAREAGVTRMTVYNQFDSKTAVYEALADDLAARGGIRNNIAAAFAEPDARAGIDKLIDAFVHFWLAEPEVLRKLHALSQLDPESRAAERDAWRREAIENMLARYHKQCRIRSVGRRLRDVDAVYMLTDFPTTEALARAGRGERQVAGRIRELVAACLGESM